MASKPLPAMALMPPPAPRAPKRKQIVLEEDEWTAKMEGIIERDFFPELGKLQDKVQWLEAVRSGDVERIREAQLNIAQRRAGQQPLAGATPAAGTLFTPGGTAARLVQEPTPFLPAGSLILRAAAEEADGSAEQLPEVPNVSLDAFLAAHTSEDNASFREILDSVNKRRRQRAATLLAPPPGPGQAATQGQPAQLLLGDGRERTEGFGTGGQQPDTQAGWRYRPMTLLMYDGGTRDSLPLSAPERAAMALGAPRSINHRATRLQPPQGSGSATPSTSADTGSPSMSTAGGRSGSARQQQRQQQQERGTGGRYDILATPLFDPGVDASPFVTWGEIEATPVRIEAEDLPPGALDGGAGGPSFRINEVRRREQKGHDLATSAAAKQRQRAAARGSTPVVSGALAALAGVRRHAGGGATTLSDAAQRLASSMHKGKQRPDADAALRASYRGSHRGGGRGWGSAAATPSRGSNWTPAGTPAGTPAAHLAAQEGQRAVLARQQTLDAERAIEERARSAALEAAKRHAAATALDG